MIIIVWLVIITYMCIYIYIYTYHEYDDYYHPEYFCNYYYNTALESRNPVGYGNLIQKSDGSPSVCGQSTDMVSSCLHLILDINAIVICSTFRHLQLLVLYPFCGSPFEISVFLSLSDKAILFGCLNSALFSDISPVMP